MKKILLIYFVSFCELLIACSGFAKSFCNVHASRPNDLVVKGAVISAAANSIQLKVLEVLKGVETRSIITIWDGKDFDCTGNISMKVSLMASVGDTILAVLPMIQAVQNTWDVVGDYSRPHWLHSEPVLKVKSDTLIGLISGGSGPGLPFWGLFKMGYVDFKLYWTTHQMDCSQLVSINENTAGSELLIRQEGSVIHLFILNGRTEKVSLLSLEGKTVEEFSASGEFKLDLKDYAVGMYVVCVVSDDGRQYRKKVIR